ncbi:MAG: antibiotic biosynthesis monooxygenase family protein [Candidatus Sulfotelmatobacter sp.]|jgi:antibiotic biosynthesis monooxygenase
MYSHIIELTAKAGQAGLLIAAIRDHAIPEIIQRAEGFVDQIVLQSDSEPDRVTSISFWESKECGGLFFKNGFRQVGALTAPFISAKPESYQLSVEVSTIDRIRPATDRESEPCGDCD